MGKGKLSKNERRIVFGRDYFRNVVRNEVVSRLRQLNGSGIECGGERFCMKLERIPEN